MSKASSLSFGPLLAAHCSLAGEWVVVVRECTRRRDSLCPAAQCASISMHNMALECAITQIGRGKLFFRCVPVKA